MAMQLESDARENQSQIAAWSNSRSDLCHSLDTGRGGLPRSSINLVGIIVHGVDIQDGPLHKPESKTENIMYRRNASLSAIVALGLLIAGFCLFPAEDSVAQSKDTNSRIYELRTYTTLPGRLPALNKRFADHTIRIFAKHGMKCEMYWIPIDDARKDNTLIYVLSHDSQEAAEKNWAAFEADPEWIKVRAKEADGKILAEAPERIL